MPVVQMDRSGKMDGCVVREACHGEILRLVEFNIAMALETESLHLDHGVVMSGVRALFDHPELGFYLVAEQAETVVGSLMVTTEWSDWRNSLFWWVQSVYVHPDYRRRGVFRALYRAVKTRAESRPDVCGCRLYVEKNNVSAQTTYSRLGMQETGYRMFEELLTR